MQLETVHHLLTDLAHGASGIATVLFTAALLFSGFRAAQLLFTSSKP